MLFQIKRNKLPQVLFDMSNISSHPFGRKEEAKESPVKDLQSDLIRGSVKSIKISEVICFLSLDYIYFSYCIETHFG